MRRQTKIIRLTNRRQLGHIENVLRTVLRILHEPILDRQLEPCVCFLRIEFIRYQT
jgi:hypothetical protein